MGINFTEEEERAFADAEVENDFEDLPLGIYQAVIDGVDPTESKAGDPMFVWKLKITGPSHAGRLVWKNQMITTKSMGFFKKDLALCGVFPQTVAEINNPALLEKLLNIPVEIKIVKNGDYTNYWFQKRLDTPAKVNADPSWDNNGEYIPPVGDDLPF